MKKVKEFLEVNDELILFNDKKLTTDDTYKVIEVTEKGRFIVRNDKNQESIVKPKVINEYLCLNATKRPRQYFYLKNKKSIKSIETIIKDRKSKLYVDQK